MVKTNQEILWNALVVTDEYFAKMGGSGRYQGFHEIHKPVLIVILYLCNTETNPDIKAKLMEMLPVDMWKKTDGLPEIIRLQLSLLSTDDDQALQDFLEHITKLINKKSKKNKELCSWYISKLQSIGDIFYMTNNEQLTTKRKKHGNQEITAL